MVGLLQSIFGFYTPLHVSILLGDLVLVNCILNPIIYGIIYIYIYELVLVCEIQKIAQCHIDRASCIS